MQGGHLGANVFAFVRGADIVSPGLYHSAGARLRSKRSSLKWSAMVAARGNVMKGDGAVLGSSEEVRWRGLSTSPEPAKGW